MPRAIHESNVAEPSFQFRGSADCLSLSRPVQRRGLAQAQPSSEVEVTDGEQFRKLIALTRHSFRTHISDKVTQL